MKIKRDQLKDWIKDLRAATKALNEQDRMKDYDDWPERVVDAVVEEMEAEL